jgi:hypothetical protein
MNHTGIQNAVSSPAECLILIAMERQTLSDLVRARVAEWEQQGGSKASYARHINVSPSHLQLMLKPGGVAIPQPKARRALADDLGIRVVDFFVMAGELRPEDIPVEGAVREPFPPNDPRRELLEAMEKIADPNQELAKKTLEVFTSALRGLIDE